jgi:glutathione S-transferase
MSLIFYGHPFSSYCQKALIALYEKDLAFTYRVMSSADPSAGQEAARLWSFGKFPVLVADGRTLAESSVIIEYLDGIAPGDPPLIPADRDAALAVRTLDRVFDNYVMTPMNVFVFDAMRPADQRDALAREQAAALLDRAYGWLEEALAGRTWAAGEDFTLADCAAAPSLFYADWVYPIGAAYPMLAAYRARLLQRPSFARCVEEARPFRSLFPPGAPDRD